MEDAKIVAKLHKTRKSINAHIARGQGLGERGAINRRGCELCDRYDDLKAELTKVGGYHNPAWKAYCEETGSALSHGGHDLFA